jgi:hypothetical protein
MVEFDLKLPREQNVVWLPKVLINSLGRNLKLTPNSVAAVLYGADADLGAVISSIELIKQDLELRLKRKTGLTGAQR